jgi:hypothetical protein
MKYLRHPFLEVSALCGFFCLTAACQNGRSQSGSAVSNQVVQGFQNLENTWSQAVDHRDQQTVRERWFSILRRPRIRRRSTRLVPLHKSQDRIADSLSGNDDFGTQTLSLLSCPACQFPPTDTIGKSEIIVDPGRASRLPADSFGPRNQSSAAARSRMVGRNSTEPFSMTQTGSLGSSSPVTPASLLASSSVFKSIHSKGKPLRFKKSRSS